MACYLSIDYIWQNVIIILIFFFFFICSFIWGFWVSSKFWEITKPENLTSCFIDLALLEWLYNLKKLSTRSCNLFESCAEFIPFTFCSRWALNLANLQLSRNHASCSNAGKLFNLKAGTSCQANVKNKKFTPVQYTLYAPKFIGLWKITRNGEDVDLVFQGSAVRAPPEEIFHSNCGIA